MTTVTEEFQERWRYAKGQVGKATPKQKIEIRRGRFYRGYHPWTFPEGKYSKIDYAVIPTSPNNQAGRPWQATWTPQSAYSQIPGLSQVTTQKDTTQNNGIGQATVTVENVRLLEKSGPLDQIYHIWDRGYLSPWRGFKAQGKSPTGPTNEWFERLLRNAQIRIWQGYGEDVWVPTFTGLIDSCEVSSGQSAGAGGGDQVIITARDFGRVLVDETLYGWNIDPALFDPIVFCDRGWANSNPGLVGDWWMRIDDCADIVRLMLRWAGFKHWQVEDTGQSLNPGQPLNFNRTQSYMDVINQICKLTGFIFFIGDPDPNDHESIGIPVFRYPRSLVDLKEVEIVHDRQLLTDVQVTTTDADRAYIIRVRGRSVGIQDPEGLPIKITPQGQTPIDKIVLKAEQISTDSGDFTLRPMFVYRPPWTKQDQEAGILKHVNHTDDYLVTVGDCRTACFLIAAFEALAAYTAQFQCPANPALGLDEHVSIWDHGTGMSTRVYCTNVQSSFMWGIDQAGNSQPFWYQTISGSLLDTPDLVAIKKELRTANLDFLPVLKTPALRG